MSTIYDYDIVILSKLINTLLSKLINTLLSKLINTLLSGMTYFLTRIMI
jgi:hypothetical protein